MARLRPLVLLPPLAFAALAALFAVGMMRENPDELPSALVGQVAPRTELAPLGSLPGFTDEDLRSGGVKLVNYWASWCAPCRVEHPTLTQLAAEGIPVFGINYKDPPRNAMAFLQELGDPYVGLGVDPDGRSALNWGVYGVPETFVLDGEGRIVLRIAGPVTQRVLETRLRPAMEQAATR
ncbi:MAG: DsbE family thiol:disulfide interchange protein [Rubellimicrobium sp.]|nr:DsbE family thiol:disulfide interchange protein [Rubellimicrobium sp.]